MSEPLDVLMVSQPASYGVAVFVRQLTEAAVVAGHRVTVASPGSERGPLAGWVVEAGATHVDLDMARGPSLRDLPDLWAIRRLMRGRDVVHLHSSKAAALGRVGALSLGRRRPAVVMTPHYWSWHVGGALASRVYRWIERVLARRCDAIVSVSEGEAREGRETLGADVPITVINNGVDRTHFSPEGDRAPRDVDAALVVCVGRLSEQKGQDVAIRALARSRHRTARLRLVGDESEHGVRRRLEDLAVSLGVAERVEWRGEVTDPSLELRAADVVIAPSRWEGMSLVFLEAMACGAAMVVSDVSGSEVVDGVGLVVSPSDAAALADAVDALLDDAEMRRSLGAAARDRSGSYDLATTLDRNIELWSDVARAPAIALRTGGR